MALRRLATLLALTFALGAAAGAVGARTAPRMWADQLVNVTTDDLRWAKTRVRVNVDHWDPGAQTGLHRHPGPTVIYVLDGEVEEVFPDGAKHARRTVNPPDDTWVAFAPDRRGYKKHCHFKVAVSRNCVRFLFEVGPEHADKARWRAAWKRNAAQLGAVLRRVQGLAWFKNEHDEEPAGMLSDLDAEGLTQLAEDRLR